MRPRLLFYVQHLLGIGHLIRASRIASALARRFEVLLVVGGEIPPGVVPDGVTLLRLPPVRAGAEALGTLVHPDGTPFGPDDKAMRRDLLLGRFGDVSPDVLLIEAFPFGRRQMRFELLPLLDRAASARHRPLIACSVRDILQDTSPDRQAETVDMIRRHFDLVLVHGDPRLVMLSDSYPAADRFRDRIVYTGMVGPGYRGSPPGEAPSNDEFEVIVSVGGGAVGSKLVEAALAARPLTRLASARWLVLTGPNGAATRLSGLPDEGVSIRPFLPDLPARLTRARVSVSQAGYNTAADLLVAQCRAVLVPFAAGGETEQTRRAALFEDRGWAVALAEAQLDPTSLAVAIDRALALPAPDAEVSVDGAEATGRILQARLDGV